MRGFQSTVSKELANKPASVELRVGEGWNKTQQKQTWLAQPAQQQGLHQQVPDRKWASAKLPSHQLIATLFVHSSQA